jgi:small-conductance mechanosensitive channel
MGFGESSLDFEVRAWTEQFDSFLGIRSAICVRIVERLAEAGLEVPFPQRDLHLKSVAAAVRRDASAEADAEESPAPPPLRTADDDRRAGPD